MNKIKLIDSRYVLGKIRDLIMFYIHTIANAFLSTVIELYFFIKCHSFTLCIISKFKIKFMSLTDLQDDQIRIPEETNKMSFRLQSDKTKP